MLRVIAMHTKLPPMLKCRSGQLSEITNGHLSIKARPWRHTHKCKILQSQGCKPAAESQLATLTFRGGYTMTLCHVRGIDSLLSPETGPLIARTAMDNPRKVT